MVALNYNDINRDNHISTNLNWLKVLCLQIIIAGHFFTKEFPLLWVLAGVALILFGVISSYYTIKTKSNIVHYADFYYYKAKKIFPTYWVLSCVIMLIALYPYKKIELSYTHTCLHLLGLSGVLNWLNIPNEAPLGNGLWFLTILIIFLALYPLIVKIYKNSYLFWFVSYCSGGILIFLTMYFVVDHLWGLAVWGFLLGIILASVEQKVYKLEIFFLKIFLCNMIITGLCFLFYPQKAMFSLLIITGIALCILNFSLKGTFHFFPKYANFMSHLGLHIYVLHGYLFIYPFDNMILNYITTVILIVTSSIIINKITSYILN